MIKKIFLILILVLFLCLALVIQRHRRHDEFVVIQFASWGSESEVNILKPILTDFERENPKIRVEFLHIPQNYFQKLHLLFASNTSPDVIFMNNQYLPLYASAGVIEGLNGYGFDFNSYYPQALKALSYNGEIYAIPRDVSNLVIYYNKSLFRKYNVPYPKQNWTLEDFLNTASKLTHRPDIFGVSFDEEPLFFIPYLTVYHAWTQGDVDNFFDGDIFENKNIKKALNFYSSLRLTYHVAPLRVEVGSATMAQLFLQQRLGMHLSGRWLVPKYRQEAKFDWDVVNFPTLEAGKNSVVPLDASGWCISKSSKHKDAAVKLVKFLSSKASSEKFTQSGLIVPARMEVAKSKIFLDDKQPINSEVFLSVLENSVPTPHSVNYKKITDLLKIKTETIFNK